MHISTLHRKISQSLYTKLLNNVYPKELTLEEDNLVTFPAYISVLFEFFLFIILLPSYIYIFFKLFEGQ